MTHFYAWHTVRYNKEELWINLVDMLKIFCMPLQDRLERVYCNVRSPNYNNETVPKKLFIKKESRSNDDFKTFYYHSKRQF